MLQIDLNSDMGESFGAWTMGDDAALLDIVSSANIACGFHAGDPAGLLDTLRAASARGVVIGAHVAYRDLAGFGRRDMDIAPRDLIADLIYQIGALQALAHAAGTAVRYVKPHGALYNRIAHDRRQAHAVIEAIRLLGSDLSLMVLAGAPVVHWARAAGLHVVTEAFADRAYTAQGTLVPRSQPGAVIHDVAQVAQRVLQLAKHNTAHAVDGSLIRIHAQSVCVHGDSPGAVQMARAVRDLLTRNDIRIAAFSNPCTKSTHADTSHG